MHLVWTLIALPAALVQAVALAQTVLTVRRVPVLADVPPTADAWPSLSIITPARDEQDVIEDAVTTALAADYPALQVVVVDDRSTDATGAIIDALAASDDRVVAAHITELPEGWLGKVHAMQRGVENAQGEWLLFADADTHYAPAALRRAIAFALRSGADLVTAYPHLTSRGPLAGTVFAVAPVLAQLSMPMWRVNAQAPGTYAGMGAFILVRRAALDRTPGLAWIRLEVADDMGIGLLIKQHGGRVMVVNGRDTIFIEFYASLRQMVTRMQKNWWAIIARCNVARALGVAVVLLWAALSPLVFLAPGASPLARSAAVFAWLALTASSVLFNRWVRRPLLPTLFPSVGLLLCAFMLLRATVLGRRIGGVEWRGTVYRADELLPHQRVLL